MKLFEDYKNDAPNQITMANGAFYPDILVQACELYKPVLVYFGQLLKVSPSSEMLLKEITKLTQTWNYFAYSENTFLLILLLRCLNQRIRFRWFA